MNRYYDYLSQFREEKWEIWSSEVWSNQQKVKQLVRGCPGFKVSAQVGHFTALPFWYSLGTLLPTSHSRALTCSLEGDTETHTFPLLFLNVSYIFN